MSFSRTALRTLIRTYPVASFIVLAYAFAYLIGLPLKLHVFAPLVGNHEIGTSYLSRIFIDYSPALAAIIVTAATGGNVGVRKLLNSLRPQTKHIIWWVGLPFAGIIITFCSFMIAGFSYSELMRMVIFTSPLLLVLHFVCAILVIGIGEELGWRGWLLPKLGERFNARQATLIIFLAWALWHFPVVFVSWKLTFCVVVLSSAVSVLFTRFWDHVTGNIFVIAVAHASLDFPSAFLQARIGNERPAETANAMMIVTGFILLIAVIVYLWNPGWWAKYVTHRTEAVSNLPGSEELPIIE